MVVVLFIYILFMGNIYIYILYNIYRRSLSLPPSLSSPLRTCKPRRCLSRPAWPQLERSSHSTDCDVVPVVLILLLLLVVVGLNEGVGGVYVKMREGNDRVC